MNWSSPQPWWWSWSWAGRTFPQSLKTLKKMIDVVYKVVLFWHFSLLCNSLDLDRRPFFYLLIQIHMSQGTFWANLRKIAMGEECYIRDWKKARKYQFFGICFKTRRTFANVYGGNYRVLKYLKGPQKVFIFMDY